YERDKYRKLIRINETEIAVLNRKFHNLPTGEEFENPVHLYSQDIDLFGKGSFFQYLNRTALTEGSHKLAYILLENNIDGIEAKQNAIKELAEKADWRQNFSALATLVHTENRSNVILNWLKNYQAFVPGILKWLPWVFS
ncbi:DNA mismatch repair protein MutS, partial [Flavobacterium sp. IR1]